MVTDQEIKQQTLSREEVNRLFEKQARCKRADQESYDKEVLDWYRHKWLTRKRSSHEFPNDAVAQMKRWREDRRSEAAGARLEAREIQDRLADKSDREYTDILKQGVLEGKIQIHETDRGFMIDTPREKVKTFVQSHPKFRKLQPAVEELKEGRFLLGTVTDWEKERVSYVRKSLIDELHAENPSDFMLVDLAVSNYIRAMYATKTEMESIRHADSYRMEMYEIMMEGLQGYIHACQNQFLRVLTALRARRQPASTFSYETHSRTDINLENWGMPLILALADITENKQEYIDIDEIKNAMSRYLGGIDPETISNRAIGYALIRYGFTSRIHVLEGNRYTISRDQVLRLLPHEELKS
ncbi:MAG: hypothetical protein WCC94_12245 [Candidatus Bathyarchaeia archaeon]